MARQVKCQWCGEKDDKNTMEVASENKSGKRVVRKYCHPDCLTEYKKDLAFKEKEKKELDALVKVIKIVHNLPSNVHIPNSFFPFLQKLRNGTVNVRNKEKKYKEGFTYRMIAETYRHCYNNGEFDWAMSNKEFNSLLGELRYYLAIVSDKILYVQREKEAIMKRKKKEKEQTKEKEKQRQFLERELKYKKRKSKNDISDFL